MRVILNFDLSSDKFYGFLQNLTKKGWIIEAIGAKEDGSNLHTIIKHGKPCNK